MSHALRLRKKAYPCAINFEDCWRLIGLLPNLPPESKDRGLSFFHDLVTEPGHCTSAFESEIACLLQELLKRGMGCFSHPPYDRSLFLGPELFLSTTERAFIPIKRLLCLGASLDYCGPSFLAPSEQRTALEWAINFGDVDIVLQLALARNNFQQYEKSIRTALRQAEFNLSSSHPRDSIPAWIVTDCRSSEPLDVYGAWEMSYLPGFFLSRLRPPVSKLEDSVIRKILELALIQDLNSRHELLSNLRKFQDELFWHLHGCVNYDEYPPFVNELANLLGIQEKITISQKKALEKKPSRLRGRLIRWKSRIWYDYCRFRQNTWAELMLATVGLAICLRALFEHKFYEFLAWMWMQHDTLRRSWPFIWLSLAVFLVSKFV